NAVARRHFRGLICLSNPEYDLYIERFDPAVEKDIDDAWGQLLDSLFRYFDGRMTVLDIAEKHRLDYARLRAYLEKFKNKGLISLDFAPITRPSRVQDGDIQP